MTYPVENEVCTSSDLIHVARKLTKILVSANQKKYYHKISELTMFVPCVVDFIYGGIINL